jgi:hypothetical protein
MAWDNRIIGEADVAPDQLLGNPYNWRVHSTFQKEALTGVLSSIGWVQRIIVNQRTQHVIDGHARIDVALRHEEPLVPVVYVDVSEEEEQLLLASLDPLAALAQADTAKLDALLRDVQTQDAAIQQMLEGLALQHQLIPAIGAGNAPQGETVDTAPVVTQASNVHMCQLFLTEESWPAFQEDVQRLGLTYGTTTLTDTVIKAIHDAAAQLDHSG